MGAVPDLVIPTLPTSTCAGLIFRYRVGGWRPGGRGYGRRDTLYLLKGMSCEGCARCDAIHDFMVELPGEIAIAPDAKDGDRLLAVMHDGRVTLLPFYLAKRKVSKSDKSSV